KGVARFTKRDLHQGLKGTFKRVDELDIPLTLLESHWFIRKQPGAEQAGPGRRRSPEYEVNPGWASQNSHNTQNSERAGHFEDCENCETRGAENRQESGPGEHLRHEDGPRTRLLSV